MVPNRTIDQTVRQRRSGKRMPSKQGRPAQGIVARSGQKRLRPETAPLEQKLAGTPDLEFFARANPDHAEGDMLVCLCPLTAANWLSVGMRAFKRSRKIMAARLPVT